MLNKACMEVRLNKHSLLLKRARYYLFWLPAFYLLCTTTSTYGQNIENLHIEKVQDDGFSNNYINYIQQDNDGFIWFGTGEGLIRYDGYNYKAFRNLPGDTSSLNSNNIWFLYPEKKNLWVCTGAGLSCIDINSLKIRNFKAKAFRDVFAMLPKNDSVFWIGTADGLYEFNKKNNGWHRIPAFKKNVSISSITNDQKGHLYLTGNNGFYVFTIATGTYKYYHPDIPIYPKIEKSTIIPFTKTIIDKAGIVWMGTWGAGLVRFDPGTGKVRSWSHQTDDVHLLPYKIIKSLLPDRDGNIWLGNKEGGLTIFIPSKNKFINYPVEWKSESKISGSVVALFRDRSGIIWIGSENGVFKCDPHYISFSKTDLLLKTDTGLVPAPISPVCMLKEKDGLWWTGMYEGIFTYDQHKGTLNNYNRILGLPPNFSVFNITKDRIGATWLTSRNLLVKITRQRSGKQVSMKSEIFKSDDIKSIITVLYVDKESRMWIGTHSDGIFRFDPATKKFISYHYTQKNPADRINEINAFCELSKDSLLAGGYLTGLVLIHTNTGKYEKIKWDNMNDIMVNLTINAIYKNGKDIWIGTETSGLWKTDYRLKKPSIATINDGLPSMNISAIISGKQNDLWLLTSAGIVNFSLQDKKFTVFDKKNGIQNLDGLYSIIADTAGDVFFGTKGSMYNFNPASIIKNTQPPGVLITDLKIFDKNYNIHKGETIKLDYTQNYFSFEYVALNYTQPKLNRYAYKMDGLDKKWNDAGSRRYVSYANLDEGTYVFNVKACNNEGVWNNVPAKLILIISPPFWHRWWFYLSIVAIIASMIYIVYAYKMNQLKMTLQLRDKIARDLHDDIGSTLSGINIFSKIALQKINTDQNSSRELLEKISSRSERTLDALSDIVWSINTRNDSIDNFLRKAREYLAEILEVQGIPYRLIIDTDMETLKIGMGTRKELYLIFKEAICNASKYAQCSFVEICLTRHKDTCTLTIRDNGKGFNVNSVSPGNGIYNMKHRAGKIDAIFDIESEKDKGTLITLKFRIPRFR
jgi:ligand-binding sensor domain-containing protein/two-component sensor histidine kinase